VLAARQRTEPELVGRVRESALAAWLGRLRPATVSWALMWAGVVALPALAVLFCVRWILGASPWNFVPVWSDEVDYWHEAASFVQVGFGTGQYGFNETGAPFHPTPFGTHGPAYPLLMGTVEKIVGVSAATPMFVGVGAVTGALIVAAWWWRHIPPGRVLLLGALLLTTWPLLLYLPTNMVEPLYAAAAIVLGAGFAVLVRGEPAGAGVVVPMGVVLAMATLLRPTWGPLWVPYLVLVRRSRRPAAKAWRPAALGVAIALLGLAFSVYCVAPYPEAFLNSVRAATGVSTRLELVWDHFRANVESVLLGRDSYGGRANPMERLVFDQLIALAVVGFVWSVALLRRKRRFGAAWTLHAWNLVPVVGFVLVVHETLAWRGVRFFFPHMLLTLIVLAGAASIAGRLVVAGIVVSAAVSFGTFHATFKQLLADHFPASSPQIAVARAAFANAGIRFEPGARRWCNTVLWNTEIASVVLGVPRGLGLSYVLTLESIVGQPKSRWVVLTDDAPERAAAGAWGLHARAPLAPRRTIYENPRSRCR
jgi:hypothetical protein